jgi:hypothetical protein
VCVFVPLPTLGPPGTVSVTVIPVMNYAASCVFATT